MASAFELAMQNAQKRISSIVIPDLSDDTDASADSATQDAPMNAYLARQERKTARLQERAQSEAINRTPSGVATTQPVFTPPAVPVEIMRRIEALEREVSELRNAVTLSERREQETRKLVAPSIQRQSEAAQKSNLAWMNEMATQRGINKSSVCQALDGNKDPRNKFLPFRRFSYDRWRGEFGGEPWEHDGITPLTTDTAVLGFLATPRADLGGVSPYYHLASTSDWGEIRKRLAQIFACIRVNGAALTSEQFAQYMAPFGDHAQDANYSAS